ncbi:MAG: 2-C-methyl-D-erythritol 4-phosphate cytidylyltransferase [Lachnospiraceae bacterium]|nr:2-C-methyl-D-erythritol 4-phosphate cytidylyltransferase [Lachnospiraceae bacterium]
MTSIAILLAAGSGTRMKSIEKKQYMLLKDRPILYYALKALEDSYVSGIFLVVNAGDEDLVRRDYVEKYGFTKVMDIVAGGNERYHSVLRGLEAAENYRTAHSLTFDRVLIQDSARPFLTKDILQRVSDTLDTHPACVVGMPVKDTIKIADENGMVDHTPNRNLVWAVQTPQAFSYDLALSAYRKLGEREQELLDQGIVITDDAMVVETLTDTRIRLVQGSYENIKITTPEDLITAEKILDSSKNGLI